MSFVVRPSNKEDTSFFGQEHICLRCKGVFSYRELGTMRCRFHTGIYGNNLVKRNPRTFTIKKSEKHYSCCRATKVVNDRIHYEKFPPYGCVPIDHISSEEEFDLVHHPYTLIPEMYFKELNLSKKDISRLSIINEGELPYQHIKTREDMQNVVAIQIVSEYSELGKFRTDDIAINIEEEYNKMLRKYNLDTRDDFGFSSITTNDILNSDQSAIKSQYKDIDEKFNKSSGIYYNFENIGTIYDQEDLVERNDDGDDDGDNDKNQQQQKSQKELNNAHLDVQKDSFIPFYIIRRVGSKLDPDKLQEYDSYSSCGYL